MPDNSQANAQAPDNVGPQEAQGPASSTVDSDLAAAPKNPAPKPQASVFEPEEDTEGEDTSAGDETEEPIDLDDFLDRSGEEAGGESGPQASLPQSEMPTKDRLCIVGLFVDDSGSMDHLEEAVKDGLKLAVNSLRGAKTCDYYLFAKGFRRTYYKGMLRGVEKNSFDAYRPDYGETPLISRVIEFVRELVQVANKYRLRGIPTTIALLIMTDGEPNSESAEPKDFKEYIGNVNYVEGMGITEPDKARIFRTLFKKMGIEVIVTPKSDPKEVRHGFSQFSQSVASIM